MWGVPWPTWDGIGGDEVTHTCTMHQRSALWITIMNHTNIHYNTQNWIDGNTLCTTKSVNDLFPTYN